jgi:thiol-disulfide isomerase/thioredoxin
VHKKGALLLLILLVIVIILTVLWEDETSDTTNLPVEYTTVVITKNAPEIEDEKRFSLKNYHEKVSDDLSEEENTEVKKDNAQSKRGTGTFTLINTKGQTHRITISDQNIELLDNQKPIIIVNLFASWCPPCIGQIAYMNDLQKKYQKELFIAGILTHDTIDKSSLGSFMAKHQVNYFVSHHKDNDSFTDLMAKVLGLDENFSIPLTVIYLDGEYFTHYEGSIPVEMVEYDIQQAIKQFNSR